MDGWIQLHGNLGEKPLRSIARHYHSVNPDFNLLNYDGSSSNIFAKLPISTGLPVLKSILEGLGRLPRKYRAVK
jgi:hypothetical protein